MDSKRIEPPPIVKLPVNPWVLPALLLWFFAPVMLVVGSLIVGARTDKNVLAPFFGEPVEVGLATTMFNVGLWGMPLIVYPCSIVFVCMYTKRGVAAATLIAFPVTIGMCGANFVAAFAGCFALMFVADVFN